MRVTGTEGGISGSGVRLVLCESGRGELKRSYVQALKFEFTC